MIRARAGSLPTSAGQAAPLPGGASDLRVLKQLGKLRAPRFLSKRNSPPILTTTHAVPGKPKSMTRLWVGEGVPCSMIQKELAATWAHHSSHRTPLHLESLPHWQGFISWVMDSHIRQLHLTKGQKAQAGFRCVPSFSLSISMPMREGLFCFPTAVSLISNWIPMCWNECRKLGSCPVDVCLSVQACRGT